MLWRICEGCISFRPVVAWSPHLGSGRVRGLFQVWGEGPMRWGAWCCTERAKHLPAADVTASSGHLLNLSIFTSEMGRESVHSVALLGRFHRLFAVKLSVGPGTTRHTVSAQKKGCGADVCLSPFGLL